MNPSKLTSMALSEAPRFQTHKQTQRDLHGLLNELRRAFRSWSLKREKRALWRSFCRVSSAYGVRMDKQAHTPQQQQRLQRIREIESELRQLNYTDR